MHRFKKIAKRLLVSGVIVIASFYIGLFLYFRFTWNNHYSKRQVDTLITSINSAPSLSDSFYDLYDKIYKDRHERITTRYFKVFWSELLMRKYPQDNNWQYVAANMQPYKGYRYKVAPMTLAFRINQEASPEKCFDFIMADRYSKYCKEFKLIDTITNLKDKNQILKFIIANERAWYYRRHPTKYALEVDSIKQLLSIN